MGRRICLEFLQDGIGVNDFKAANLLVRCCLDFGANIFNHGSLLARDFGDQSRKSFDVLTRSPSTLLPELLEGERDGALLSPCPLF